MYLVLYRKRTNVRWEMSSPSIPASAASPIQQAASTRLEVEPGGSISFDCLIDRLSGCDC